MKTRIAKDAVPALARRLDGPAMSGGYRGLRALAAVASTGLAAFVAGLLVGSRGPAAVGDGSGVLDVVPGSAPVPLAARAPSGPVVERRSSSRATIELGGERSPWKAVAEALLAADRVDDAAEVLRAAIAGGVAITDIEKALARVSPPMKISMFRILRGHGIGIPSTPGAWEVLLASTGHIDEVGQPSLESLSAAQYTHEMRLLLGGRIDRFDLARLRAHAERDRWPGYKLIAVADALAGTKHSDADAWRTWGERAQASERAAREADDRATFARALTEARADTGRVPPTRGAWLRVGSNLLALGDVAGAADAFEQELALYPVTPDAARALAEIDHTRALRAIGDRWDDAVDDEVLLLLAKLRLRAGLGREAATTYFRRRSLDGAWLDVGISRLAPVEALEAIRPRLAAAASPPLALLLAKADALAALGRTGEAVAALEGLDGHDAGRRLLDIDASAALSHWERAAQTTAGDDAQVYLAEAERRAGRGDSARDRTDAFVRRAPRWFEWSDDVAAYVVAADPSRLPRLEQYVAEDPDGRARILARAYEALGRSAEATAEYDRALRQNPDDVETAIRRLLPTR